MNLDYPPEAEEFRSEVRALLDRALPADRSEHHRLVTDLAVTLLGADALEIQRTILAESVLGLPKEPRSA